MKISHVVASAIVVSQLPDTPCVWNCIVTIGGVCAVREHVLSQWNVLNITVDDIVE